MNARALKVQGALTATSLLVAYAVASRADINTQGEAIVVEAARADIERIHFKLGEDTIDLTPGRDRHGPRINAVISPRKTVPLSGMTPTMAPERRVRGSVHVEELFKLMAPFRADRSLGTLDATTLGQLGFGSGQRELTVTVRGTPRHFVIATPPVGSEAPYLRDVDSGAVYMVSRLFLNVFIPSVVSDGRRHLFGLVDIDHIVASIPGTSERHEWKTRSPGVDMLSLFDASAPEKELPDADAWHRELWHVDPVEVLGENETPPEGEPVVALKVEYFTSRGELLGFAEFGRAGTYRNQPWVFARSDLSPSWLRLPPGTASVLREGERLARGSAR